MIKIINEILNDYNNMIKDFDVYIVADLQKKTSECSSKHIIHSDETEFFSRMEFSEISSAIFYCFGYARTFFSEEEFMKYILNNDISHNECIVYNFARDGRANGKKSLIPSFCDLFNIRYTGSDAFVISLLRNKYVFTKLLESNGIFVPQSVILSLTDSMDQLELYNNKTIIIKNKVTVQNHLNFD